MFEYLVFGFLCRRSQQQPARVVRPGWIRPVRPPQEPDAALQPVRRLPVRPGSHRCDRSHLQTGEPPVLPVPLLVFPLFNLSAWMNEVWFVVSLCPGCSGASGEAGEVEVLSSSDPPAEQPDVPSVPGAGPDPAQPAGPLPRPQVLSGLERQRGGEAEWNQNLLVLSASLCILNRSSIFVSSDSVWR